ncbi:MAG: uroporphyrinogen decarboxylase, partial [Actinobacteria bacterium]|nr:uroporphyrinogen decarboxylase [Actinomycetota bacterium]
MRLLAALGRQPLDRPPVWLMRQAGRYLPEYRAIRAKHDFLQAMTTPELAAEITLQPLRRFPLDAAIVFADIMSPLPAMGVEVAFDPGPRLTPIAPEDVALLGDPDPARVAYLTETIKLVREGLDPAVATIGFAGAPVTL